MIRPILTEFALFLVPFGVYAVFLLVTRAGVLDPESWSWQVLSWLTIAALMIMIVSFVAIAQFSGAPPYSTYIPAHMENGKLVPGRSQ